MNARALRDDLQFVLEDSGHTIVGLIAFHEADQIVDRNAGLIVRLRDGSQYQVLVICDEGPSRVPPKDGAQ